MPVPTSPCSACPWVAADESFRRMLEARRKDPQQYEPETKRARHTWNELKAKAERSKCGPGRCPHSST